MKLISPLRWWLTLKLFLFFLKEVFLANLQVVRLVFLDNEKITPAIVKVPLRASSDLEIFLFSSMVTLTPGTLSLSVSEDRKALFVHVIHSSDPQASVQAMQAGFETRILEVLR